RPGSGAEHPGRPRGAPGEPRRTRRDLRDAGPHRRRRRTRRRVPSAPRLPGRGDRHAAVSGRAGRNRAAPDAAGRLPDCARRGDRARGEPVNVQLSVSILSADFARLGEAVAATERGGADQIHLDVMDGHFVPNITFGPPLVAAIRRITRLPLDVHLMITDPDRYLDAFAEAGATTISVHAEVLPHLH